MEGQDDFNIPGAMEGKLAQGLDPAQILKAPNVVCPECGGKVFQEGVVLKKISQFLSPTGKEEYRPIPIIYCVKCGTVPDEVRNRPSGKAILGETEILNV